MIWIAVFTQVYDLGLEDCFVRYESAESSYRAFNAGLW